MYSRIVNPITGRTVSVRGTTGKNILRNYVAALSNILKGGSESSVTEDERIGSEEAHEIFKASGFRAEYSTMFIVGYMVGADPSLKSALLFSRDLDEWR